MTTSSSHRDWEELFETAPCGLLSIAPDGRIIGANNTLSEITGYSKEEIIGEQFHRLLTITGRIFYESHVAPLLHMQGHFEEATLDLAAKDGRRIPVLANARERRNADGALIGVYLSLFKVTERRLYERELVAARTATESKLSSELEVSKLRDQFIAVLGHDLRSPLASLAAAIRILGREMPNERIGRVLVQMQSSVTRMAEIIDDVLDFARGRMGGGLTIQTTDIGDLEAVLNQVLEEFRTSFPDRVVEKHFDAEPFVFDPSRMGQLFSNLLANAFTHGAEKMPVRVGASTRGGTLSLWVANQGKPISPEARVHLFEPFFRGSVRPSQQGLGLGLYIASEIAKAHGGELIAESSEDETRFTFTMPLIRDDQGGSLKPK